MNQAKLLQRTGENAFGPNCMSAYNHGMNRIKRMVRTRDRRRSSAQRLAHARRNVRYAAIVLREIIEDLPWEGESLRELRLRDAEDLLCEAHRLVRRASRGA